MNIANVGRESLRGKNGVIYSEDHWPSDLVIAVLEALETFNKLR